MDSVKEKLNNLEKKGQEFRQEGKLLEALDLMEEALNMKRAYFGAESDEYIESQERVAELSNVIALFYLQKGRAEVCLEYLKKAENISWNRPKYRAITNNNFACFYRKRGKFRVALNYLEQALKIEKTLENQKDLADTHLNLCAILSQLGQHTDALEHVLTAIMLLQDDLIYTQSIEETSQRAEKISALVVAYHNLAVEYEYMKRFDDAQKTFERALKLSEKHFGENHYLYKNLTRIVSGGGSQATFKTPSQFNRIEPKMSVNTVSSTQGHRINVVRRPQSAAIVDTAKVVKLKNVYSPKIKPPQSAGHSYPTIGLTKKPSTSKLTSEIPTHPQSHKPSITIPPHRTSDGRHERQDKNSLSPIEKRNDITDKSFGFPGDDHMADNKGKQSKHRHDKTDDSLDFNSFDDEAKLD